MGNRHAAIARAKTVLVFEQGSEARAVITTVGARATVRAGQPELTCVGPAVFEPQVVQHLNSTVLPAANRILHLLELPPRSFEIGLVNLGAASSYDQSLSVSGYSADVPVLLAMLSAALHLQIPQDVVATGHVASPGGDIRPVKSLPAKIVAALADRNIRQFIYPDVDADSSMQFLAPQERQAIHSAALQAKERLVLTRAADVHRLVQRVFADEFIVAASLHAGFFDTRPPALVEGSPVDLAACLLLADNEARFWRVLDEHLTAGNGDEARKLILSRARYQVRQRRYPTSFGKRLLQSLRTIPPAVRRLKIRFPLLRMDMYIQLSQFASEADHEDVQYLMQAISDRWAAGPEHIATDQEPGVPADRDAAAAVETVFGMISAQSLALKIGLPIDTARASFALDRPTTDSHEQFSQVIEAFYLRLLQHMESDSVLVPSPMLAAEAQSLLERAFAGKGGTEAAWAEVRFGLRGGTRVVLDTVHEAEQQNRYVNQVLTQVLDPLDWTARVNFMAAMLKRIGPDLPEEIRGQPPERFARHYQDVVKAYVRSIDQVRQLLQRY